MKKDIFDDIFGDIGSIMPPKMNYTPKTESLKDKKGEKILKGAPLGELLAKYEYDSGLIKAIEIRAWGTQFNFYDGFIQYAVNYYKEEEEQAEYVPFFSFTPQYAQMTLRQMKYYLYWRGEFRKGRCIKADFSYILLFIYEVLNLPENLLSAKKGVRYLGYLWARYRDQFPQLDKYLSEWLPDYCLSRSAECPMDLIKSFLSDILKKTTLPEFYLNKYELGNARAEMISSGSEYDFNRSVWVNDKNREIFKKHINMALESCFLNQSTKGEGMSVVTQVRDTYVGALCLYENKRRMTLTYCKLEKADVDTLEATEAVKYAESLVRSGLGLRAKNLKTMPSPAIKERIDRYFSEAIESFENPTEPIIRVSEKRYEPITRGFSGDEADKIELESRKTAEMLEGDSFNEELRDTSLENDIDFKAEKTEEEGEEASYTVKNGLSEELREYLEAIYKKGYGDFLRLCKQRGALPEAIIEEINYFAFLTIEDIVLEGDEDEYKVIQDYVQEVEQWLKK